MGAILLLDGVIVEKNAMVAVGALVRQNTRIPSGEVCLDVCCLATPIKFMRIRIMFMLVLTDFGNDSTIDLTYCTASLGQRGSIIIMCTFYLSLC